MRAEILDTLRAIVGPEDVLTGDQIVDRSLIWGTNQPCIARAVSVKAA